MRLPSKEDDAPVFRITEDNVATDWLSHPGSKAYYAHFRNGNHVTPPEFNARVDEEQSMLEEAMARYNLAMKPEDFIDACNAQLREYLRPPPVVSTCYAELHGVDGSIRVRVLPEESESQASTSGQPESIHPDRDGHYQIPICPLPHATSDK